MSEEKWIVYCDRCQSLEKKLTLLESERDRLRKENEDFKEHTDNLQFLINKKNVERDRLSTELIHAQATICDMEDKESMLIDNKRLREERDRLRKGLEEIAKYPTYGLLLVEDVRDIARTALESNQGEGREAVVTKIGYIGEDGNPTGFEFDCSGNIPGFQVEGDKILYGGWTVEELKEMIQPEGREVDIKIELLSKLEKFTSEWIDVGGQQLCDHHQYTAIRLLEVFDIRKREG